jgi:hypothetical protein
LAAGDVDLSSAATSADSGDSGGDEDVSISAEPESAREVSNLLGVMCSKYAAPESPGDVDPLDDDLEAVNAALAEKIALEKKELKDMEALAELRKTADLVAKAKAEQERLAEEEAVRAADAKAKSDREIAQIAEVEAAKAAQLEKIEAERKIAEDEKFAAVKQEMEALQAQLVELEKARAKRGTE